MRSHGHAMRREEECLAREAMESSIPGRRYRGRPRKRRQDNENHSS